MGVPRVDRVGCWLRLRGLDARGAPAVYTLGVRLTDRGDSAGLVAAKRGPGRDRDYWLSRWRTAAGRLPLGGTWTVVPAVGSSQRWAEPSSFAYRLALELSRVLQWPFAPRSLTSSAYPSLHSSWVATERAARVAGAYRVVAALDGPVVVVDDFVTCGHTLADIARALRAAGHRAPVVGVVMSKTERDSHFSLKPFPPGSVLCRGHAR